MEPFGIDWFNGSNGGFIYVITLVVPVPQSLQAIMVIRLPQVDIIDEVNHRSASN